MDNLYIARAYRPIDESDGVGESFVTSITASSDERALSIAVDFANFTGAPGLCVTMVERGCETSPVYLGLVACVNKLVM